MYMNTVSTRNVHRADARRRVMMVAFNSIHSHHLPVMVMAVNGLFVVVLAPLVRSRVVPDLGQRLVILRAPLRALGTVLDVPSS